MRQTKSSDANIVSRVRAGLHISSGEFARSMFTAMGDLTQRAIELEATGLPRAVIAMALIEIGEKWAASGSHAGPMQDFVLVVARRFPSGSPKLADLQTEYESAIKKVNATRGY